MSLTLLLQLALAAPSEEEVIVVTGTFVEERQDRAVVKTRVIGRQEIEESGARNLADLLETVPGLQVVPGLAGPVLQARGMEPDHTLFVIDGARLVGRVNGGLDLRRFPVEDLEQIEIVFGAGSTLWGADALGAVVHLRTRNPGKGIRSEAGLTIGRYLSPTRGHAADTTTPLTPVQGIDSTDLVASVEGGGRVRGRMTVEHRTAAGWDENPERPSTTGDATRMLRLGGQVQLEGEGEIDLTTRAEVTTWRRSGVDATATGAVLDRDNAGQQIIASVQPRARLSHRVRATGGLHFVRWQDTFRYDQRNSNLQDSLQNLRDQLVQARSDFDIALHSRHLLNTGAEGQAEALRADRLVEGKALRQRGAAYVQHRWDTLGTEDLVITSGIRADADSWFGTALSPRVAALWVPEPTLRLRASAGRGFKAPDLRELFLDFSNPSAGYRVDGNPDLQPEYAWNGNLGWDIRPIEGLILSAEGFWTETTNLIQPILIDEGRFGYGNIAAARIAGAELSTRLRRGPVDAQLSWTGLSTLDRENDRPLPGRAAHQVAGSLGAHHEATGTRVSARANLLGPRKFFIGDEAQKTVSTALVDLRIATGENGPVIVEIGIDNLFDPGPGQPGLLLTPPRRVWIGVHARLDRPASTKDDP